MSRGLEDVIVLRHFKRILCLFVFGASALTLAGWLFDWHFLIKFTPDFQPMAATTALLFLILSVIIALPGDLFEKRLTHLASVVVILLLIWVLMITTHSLWDSSVDIELVLGPRGGNSLINNGRISPFTSILMMMVLLGVLAEINNWPDTSSKRKFIHSAALLVIISGIANAVAYVYVQPFFFSANIVPMAIPTSLIFILLGFALECKLGMNSYLKLFVGSSVRARLLRTYLPPTIALIVLNNAIILNLSYLQKSTALVLSLLSCACLILLAIVIFRRSFSLGSEIDRVSSERDLFQRKLAENEERLRLALQAANDAIWDLNIKTGYMYLSPHWWAIIGRPDAEGDPMDSLEKWADSIVIEDKSMVLQAIDRHITRGDLLNMEYRYYCGADNIKWHNIQGQVQFDDEGVPKRLVGSIRDISDRKDAEMRLKESEENFRLIFENNSAALSIMNTDTIITMVNDAYCRVSGYSREEVVGMSWTKQIPPGELDRLLEYNRKRLKNPDDAPAAYEFRFFTKTGEIRHALMSVAFLTKNREIIAAFSDITERKLMEEQLKSYAAQLEELNATKDKFFAIIAHDLRNPFQNLLAVSEMLAEQIDDLDKGEISTFARELHNLALVQHRLLENLLSWSLIQRGQIIYQPEEFRLINLLEDILPLLRDQARQKGVEFICRVDDNVRVYADKNMCRSIVQNLTSNAVKFTSSGGKVTLAAENPSAGTIIYVEDTGVGIANEILERILRPAAQFSTQGTAREHGTGLGLILCKEFVQRHGGTINAQSNPGIGTRFDILLPYKN